MGGGVPSGLLPAELNGEMARSYAGEEAHLAISSWGIEVPEVQGDAAPEGDESDSIENGGAYESGVGLLFESRQTLGVAGLICEKHFFGSSL